MSVAVEVTTPAEAAAVQESVRALVRAVLKVEQVKGSVSVALVDEERMAELNQRFRRLPGPTDVLSFRQADGGEGWPEPTEETAGELGEVVVCPAVVRRYALEADGHPETQLGWTLIHGVLHLVGYDHERDEGQMRAREQALLARLDRQVRALALPAEDGRR